MVSESLPENKDVMSAAIDIDDSLIESGDPEIDVRAIMAQIRANIAQRQGQSEISTVTLAVPEAVMKQLTTEYGIPGRVGAQPVTLSPGIFASIDESPLEPTLHELSTSWKIRDVPFKSSAPVIGKLIVALRTGWNWMSTRWYVLSILGQVNHFNAIVARAFGEIDAEHQQLVAQLNQLQITCEQLRRELEQIKTNKDSPK